MSNNYISPNKICNHSFSLYRYIGQGESSPITAEVHLTNRCNNNCYYCGQKSNRNNIDLSADNITRLKDYLSNSYIKGVYFSGGGEPTLHPALIDLSNSLYEDYYDLGMITNGVIMTDELISCYVSNFEWVRISLDAANESTYYKTRGTNDYKTVISNLDKLIMAKKQQKSDLTIGLQIVVNEHNCNFLAYTCSMLLTYFPDIDYIAVRPIECKVGESPYNCEQLDDIFAGLESLKDFKKVQVSDKFYQLGFGFTECHASNFIITIDPNGDAYQCCHVVGNPLYKIFNLSDRDTDVKRNLPNQGFNPAICPLGCRGSGINRTVESIINTKHANFL